MTELSQAPSEPGPSKGCPCEHFGAPINPIWWPSVRERHGYQCGLCGAIWPFEEQAMDTSEQDIYTSSNGDRWQLIRDETSGRLLVRHTPNPGSGGRVTNTDVDAFLAMGGAGPEFQALRGLLEQEDG